MNDYFDHVERSLRGAIRERRHVPWYRRLNSRRARPALVAVAIAIGGGTALAATGALRTGSSVSTEVAAVPSEREGTVIASSVHLLPLRVPDPAGGPPWGLRVARTSRGLLCVEPGRVVDGRVGVIGADGAFRDDGEFHPFAHAYLSGLGCGTQDGRGDAFVNEQVYGEPASALLADRRYASRGCYARSRRARTCPDSDLRDVYFGLLGPDATSVTHRSAGGAIVQSATAAPYGAYLVVLPHGSGRRCGGRIFACRGDSGSTSSPTLSGSGAITGAEYRNAPPCRLLTQEQAAAIRERVLHRPEREASCPAVGYVPLNANAGPLTAADLSSPVTADLEQARRYCEGQQSVVACGRSVPRGYRPITMQGPPENLLVVDFVAREPVTNFDSHYEIETTTPQDPRHPGFQEACGGTFGPTQSNLRAGQHVRFTQFMNGRCHGSIRVTVGYVTVNGPSGAAPVPGLPGQSAAIPVGQATVVLP